MKGIDNFGPPLILKVKSSFRIYRYDLRVLSAVGGAKIAPRETLSEKVFNQLPRPAPLRLRLINQIHTHLNDQQESGGSARTLDSRLGALRMYIRFCDEGHTPIIGENHDLHSSFKIWVNSIWIRVDAEVLNEKSAGAYCWSVAAILAESENISSEDFASGIRMPRINTNESKKTESYDHLAIWRFNQDIEDICTSLTYESMMGRWPIEICFRDGSKFFYNGQGRPASEIRKNGELPDSSFAQLIARDSDTSLERRRSVIQLKAEAEYFRFVAQTGINDQPARDLLVDSPSFRSHASTYLIKGFKNRAGHAIEIRIPTTYRKEFEKWLSVRSRTYTKDELHLFPIGRTKGGRIERIFQRLKRPSFRAQAIRWGQAQKRLRSTEGSHPRDVSQFLQNSLPVLFRNYIKGTKQIAAEELSKFLNSIHGNRRISQVRAGGGCSSPSNPKVIEIAAEQLPIPDCINPAGCLFCKHYKAVESFDYLHRLISYRKFVRLRMSCTGFPSENRHAQDFPLIERINDFLDLIGGRSAKLSEDLKRAQTLVEAGNLHPTWQGWVDLLLVGKDHADMLNQSSY
ncbi:hypothetical protein [Variovorax gossypii]